MRSELVDPVEQRERLYAQSLLAAAGDGEAMQVDDDFPRAMEDFLRVMGMECPRPAGWEWASTGC